MILQLAQEFPQIRYTPGQKVAMVLDTDTYNEIDDQFALFYAIVSPAVKLLGVTAAPFFNDRSCGPADGMEKSFHEIGHILKLTGCEAGIPAFRGALRFQQDTGSPVDSPAARFLINRAHHCAERGETLFVCCIAALTNIAAALQLAPEIRDMVAIIWLGGHEPHVRDNPREFNLAGDIAAARTVFDCGTPLLQVPCRHVAEKLNMTSQKLKQNLPDSPGGHYLQKIFDDYLGERGIADKVIWDIGAVSCLTLPRNGKCECVARPELHDDCTWSESGSRPKMMRMLSLDSDRIFADFFHCMNNCTDQCLWAENGYENEF